MTGHQVGLKDSVFVISPYFVPDVFVLDDWRDQRISSSVVPQQAMRLHFRLDPVDHPENSNGRFCDGRAVIVISSVQEKRSVRRPKNLPETNKLQVTFNFVQLNSNLKL